MFKGSLDNRSQRFFFVSHTRSTNVY
jgi:hypothetical protein